MTSYTPMNPNTQNINDYMSGLDKYSGIYEEINKVVSERDALREACEAFVEWATRIHTPYTDLVKVLDKARTALNPPQDKS